MKKYTANYTYTNPNFVIQNLVENPNKSDLLPILYVIKNILQRGFPTTLSKNLQSTLGEIHKLDNFNDRFLFATNQTPIWNNTIKGDENKTYPPTKIQFEGNIIETHNPAKYFFENLLPHFLEEYSFIHTLILPETFITEIVESEDEGFVNQQVDFYLPQAKLIIEIDGSHHDLDPVVKALDKQRDDFFIAKGFKTIRITTKELGNSDYIGKINQIKELIQLPTFEKLFLNYKISCEKIEENKMSETEIKEKLLPTAIIRFQVLLIELLTHNYLNLNENWNFNILSNEDLGNFPELAINDLLIWLDNLYQLKNKKSLDKPIFSIKITNKKSDFVPTTKTINIDFSLFKRYTDENKINPDVIYLRTDYFDIVKDKNYFRVSTAEPINYNITDEDKSVLEFFLANIFDKPTFREGQFPIISNALNRKDTIGLLPTGGGKSLCYQLPCLLQPSINFVVCPIKSLMYDQKENLERQFLTNIEYISSDQSPTEKEIILNQFSKGKYLFIWISPERFQIQTFRKKIEEIVANFSIAYAVVDEVHCLSEWGHDFRTSYLNLAKTIDKLSPKENPKDPNSEGKIKFIGLTATASVNVLKDIKIEFSRRKQRLEDENIKSLLDYSRKELQFEVINAGNNKYQTICTLLAKLKESENFTEDKEKAALVFTPNVNGAYGCYEVSNTLKILYQNKVNWYAGSIPTRAVYNENGNKIGTENIMTDVDFKKHKATVQKDFKTDEYQILVATKAFGMGIDKENIFYTFHYGLPSSVEALYQEAGRAGRWNTKKAENEGKIGKCFVLHSPETIDNSIVQRLFDKNTTFSEMKTINQEVGREGNDIFRNIFLFTQGQNDIEENFIITKYLIDKYFEKQTNKNINYQEAENDLFNLGIGVKSREGVLIPFKEKDTDFIQKGIYRLSLLGIVSDWTTDFINHYEVQFNCKDDNDIIESVSKYITKYEPSTVVITEILKIDKPNIIEKSICYLLNWIFENIIRNRKESLYTLSKFCSEFKDSDSFKKRIDSYFVITDTTFILQAITEKPNDFNNWFEAFYIYEELKEKDENNLIKKNKIHIPEIVDEEFRLKEYGKLRDAIFRFLDSSSNNIGLNFISGFVHLALNQYSDKRGKDNFESALETIKQTFSKSEQDDFLNRLMILGKTLNIEQIEKLCLSIAVSYPEKLEELAEYYNLDSLLSEAYKIKLNKLKKLNIKLYEQFAEI